MTIADESLPGPDPSRADPDRPGSSSSRLVLRLFGPFEVRAAGEPLARPYSKKDRWLLALLALRPFRHLERSWIAGTLWPETTEEQALYYLRLSLSRLRRELGPEARRIVSPSRSTLSLDLADADVDVADFDEAVARGDHESLARAVALYRGPLKAAPRTGFFRSASRASAPA